MESNLGIGHDRVTVGGTPAKNGWDGEEHSSITLDMRGSTDGLFVMLLRRIQSVVGMGLY